MEDGLLSLKWNNHKITFFEILRTLREKSSYTDATIAVEGKFYPVHKLVMSTCSEYFQDIFSRTPCKSPVIVLKDVRSQDMDALLDYMYLGEVNVNQNDLASLLKTAECLRIKGLAVPDEDPTKLRKAPADERQDSPPPKRRRHEEFRPVSPSPSAPQTTTPLSSPVHAPLPVSTSQTTPDSLDNEPPPPIVKVEMQEDNDDGFPRQESYDGSVNEEGGGDYGVELSKTDHDPESYGSGSFPGPSLQPGGDLAWDEGDSSSFPPEGYSGELPPGQQPQGDDDNDDDIIDPLNASDDGLHDPGSSGLHSGDGQCPPPLTPISQARQCQLCLVTLANANLLRRHVEDHHFHIRKYNCVHCGKKFKRKEHKERHERIHTGEKPFVCHICNARFTQKEHLKGHVENVHHKHGEKGLDMLGDMDKDISEQEYKDDDLEVSVSSPPPPTSVGSPSLAPVSSLISIASSPSPITAVLPIISSTSTSLVSAATTTPSLLPSANTSSPITSVEIMPSSLPPSDIGVNQFTALYAPVTRKTVNSPNKHMQTITINFN